MEQTVFDISATLQELFSGGSLSKEEAENILSAIGRGKVDPHQISAFLTCYNMRPITGKELSGFRNAMIKLAIPIDFSDLDTIDVCGTGGDGKNTFNISTTASFVIAGAGYKVAKHGNYGVSSGCGSSNVLEYLGYSMSNDPKKLRKEIEASNFCYMHAPLFHPAMKEVGAIRKGLKVKTFFNMLGPLLNPSMPKHQLTGVFSESIIPLYRTAFEDIGSSYAIIRSVDGYDEISLTGAFRVVTNETDEVIQPIDIGLKNVDASDLHGGNSIKEAADILLGILEGKGNEVHNQVVCANAGFAIQRFQPTVSIEECMAEAKESLMSGKALEVLRSLMVDG